MGLFDKVKKVAETVQKIKDPQGHTYMKELKFAQSLDYNSTTVRRHIIWDKRAPKITEDFGPSGLLIMPRTFYEASGVV